MLRLRELAARASSWPRVDGVELATALAHELQSASFNAAPIKAVVTHNFVNDSYWNHDWEARADLFGKLTACIRMDNCSPVLFYAGQAERVCMERDFESWTTARITTRPCEKPYNWSRSVVCEQSDALMAPLR